MKRDTLNFSKGHASVIKTLLLSVLLTCGMNIVADDSRTPIVRLTKLAAINGCEQTNLQNFATRVNTLFSDFFDTTNKQPFAWHKANFITVIDDLSSYLKTANVDKATHKELSHMAKELQDFIKTLEKQAQQALKKGANASLTDIMPLAKDLKPFAHLVPDVYFKSLSGFLSALLHRVRCTELSEEPAAKRSKLS